MNNFEATINQMQQLHKKTVDLWMQKQKYMQSMQKSKKDIVEIQSKPWTEQRIKLVNKMKNHIMKVLSEYQSTIDGIFLNKAKSKQCLDQLSLSLAQ